MSIEDYFDWYALLEKVKMHFVKANFKRCNAFMAA